MLKNFWYAVEEVRAIGATPKRITVLGQELALFRKKSDGRIVALSNLCVHRGGSLADGTVDGDCVRCPYHGWTFDGDGACKSIPASPPGAPIPKKAHVDAYPVEERYGWVWVFLGDLPAAERPPIPPLPEFGQPGWRAVYGEFLWKAHYSRVVENGIDIAHTPWVHQNSFGNRDKPQIPDYEVTMDDYSASGQVTLESRPPRGLWKILRPNPTPVTATVTVYVPSVSRLDLDLGKWRTIVFDSNIPIDENTTLTRFIQLRNFFTGAWADGDAKRRMMKIFQEDQRTVEAQRPELLPYDLSAELHIKSDGLAVAFRKLRKKYMDMGWGIDQHLIRARYSGRSAVVIPSPARRAIPELEKAWVMPEVPVIQLHRKASNQ
jgi:phenylpropionate dioxygenase-like ring-hydroxylating dioxygenase large terminal subunit